MNNKRVLQTAINELDKRKAPPAPKDIITDPAGQWKFPGQVTRIPSSTITMQGVPYPVLGVPNTGEPKMMMPGQYYDFSEADYVDEYPQMRKGGGLNSKKYTRSLEGIGSLFRESALFKKPKSKKKKFFHPNAKYFQDGGTTECPPGYAKDEFGDCIRVKTEKDVQLKPLWEKDRDKYGKDYISWYEAWNPKKWGLNDYSEYSSFNSAFRNARESGEKEFVYKGERYNTKQVPKKESDMYWKSKDFVENYYKTQPYSKRDPYANAGIEDDYIKNKFGTTYLDLYKQIQTIEKNNPNDSKLYDLNQKLFAIMNEENDIYNKKNSGFQEYYDKQLKKQDAKESNERIGALNRPTYFSITSQKPQDMSEDGYWDPQKNKMFLYTKADPGKFNTTYVHEVSHKGDALWDVMETVPPINLKAFNDGPWSDRFDQEKFNYVSDPSEIEARKLSTLFYLSEHKTPWEAGKITQKTLDNLYRLANEDKLPYDIVQLLDLYGAQQDDLLKYLNGDYNYNYKPKKQKGGEPGKGFKKRLMKRNPGMQGVYGPEGENLNIVRDPNYDAGSKPYYAGDIEFMFPGLPQVSYTNKDDETLPDYVYKNPSPDKYTSVYNPRGANRADIFLDMLHGMRDDQNYEVLLQNFDKAVRDARGGDMQYYYEQDVANNKYTDGQEQWDNNYVDGQLRAQLAPGTIGMFSHGRKDYRKERKHDSPEMRAAAKDIKNYLKTAKEEYIEADLTPEEIQEYAKGGFIIEELDNYAEGGDPGDVQCPPGYVYNPETKYCERKSGCPDGYTFDAKSGRCVSNYQKESVKVMAAPYKYRKDGSVIDFPNEYEDSEFKPISEDQLVYKKSAQNSTWPKDFYVKDISNPIYFKNSGVVQISTPEFVPEFEGDSEYYISTYPDLNYKVVVDSKKPEGFNKDENIYYVKSENTHQFKKYKEWEKLKALEKENLENAKKHGFILHADPPSYSQKYPDEYYKTSLNKYDENGEKIWAYDEGNYEYKPGWDEKKYRADHKTVQELYNDPEYLGWDAYDKSFDEIFKDRGTKNIETYKERCPDCTYFHGQRMTVDPDYMYDSYNPFQNKVAEGQMTRAFKTLEPDYADPNIDKQMPTLEEYGYPDMPGYNPASYKGKGIHPTYGYDKKARTHIGMHPGKRDSFKDKFYIHTTWDDDKDFRGFGTHDRTKLLPFIVQKSTGYNPEGMEGYYDEENNWVPGEYEKAAEEGRKINFQGAASLRDLRRQKDYLARYDEYLQEKSKIDEMNKELRQQWLPAEDFAEKQAEGGTPCPPGHVKLNGRCVSINKKATAQDSLDLYNNAVALEKFYKSNRYKSKQLPLPVHGWEELENARKDQKRHGSVNNKNENLNFKDYYNQVDDYRFYQRDIPIDGRGTALINTDAPMALYDSRIKPNKFTEYKHIPTKAETKAINKWLTTGNKKYPSKAGYGHDLAGVYGYDPLSVKPSHLLTNKEVKERFKKFGPSGISQSKLEKAGLVPKKSIPNKPKEQQYPTSYKPVVNNTQQKPPEGKLMVGQEEVQQLDPKTGTVTTVINPIYENLEPTMPTLHPAYINPELEKFVGTQRPVEGGWPGVMPQYAIDELPMYATPDPDAEWVGDTRRYIDWDGNSVGYNLPRFRKPGHGGDLIRKGKRRYLHLPSIETRYEAEIVPEEEYAMGGEYTIGDEVELSEAEVQRLRALGYIIEEA